MLTNRVAYSSTRATLDQQLPWYGLASLAGHLRVGIGDRGSQCSRTYIQICICSHSTHARDSAAREHPLT